MTLLVNCSKIYERVIHTVDREFTAGKLALFIGQRNGQHALFRVSIGDLYFRFVLCLSFQGSYIHGSLG